MHTTTEECNVDGSNVTAQMEVDDDDKEEETKKKLCNFVSIVGNGERIEKSKQSYML